MQEEVIQYQKDTITESGTVKVSELSSQTGGNAQAGDILKGKTAWVNGIQITGTIDDYSDKTVDASSVTTKDDYTYFYVPKNGYYTTKSSIRGLNTDIIRMSKVKRYEGSRYTNNGELRVNYTAEKDEDLVAVVMNCGPYVSQGSRWVKLNGKNLSAIYSSIGDTVRPNVYVYSARAKKGENMEIYMSCGVQTTEDFKNMFYIMGIILGS